MGDGIREPSYTDGGQEGLLPGRSGTHRELAVFKSDPTFSGTPDHSLQVGQDTAIRALCLVTYDVSAEEDDWMWGGVYYNYDPPDNYVFW